MAWRVFISYVRENSREVDELQERLEPAGVRVWRDTADLWPGEDWRAKIRQAITQNALVFMAPRPGSGTSCSGLTRTSRRRARGVHQRAGERRINDS
ncbi:MAG TPA: hypothetical protein DHU96_01330 [Actinobacteria bacterium]|nr:hypothetical protein [Actinomycetota bacterium]